MPLVKTTIQKAIKGSFEAVMNQADDKREEALDTLSGQLADAVINAIKSVTITYSTGLVAPPAGGPVTGTFTCTIS